MTIKIANKIKTRNKHVVYEKIPIYDRNDIACIHLRKEIRILDLGSERNIEMEPLIYISIEKSTYIIVA